MISFLVSRLQKLSWSIRRKIGLAFALILVCFLSNGLISVFLIYNIQSSEEQKRDNALRLERLQRFQLAYESEVTVYSDAVFITSTQFIRDNFKRIITENLRPRSLDDKSAVNREAERNFARLYLGVYDIFTEVENFIVLGQFDQARAKWPEYDPKLREVSLFLEDWGKQLEAERTKVEQDLNTVISLSIVMIVGLTIFSVALVFFLVYLVQSVLVRPLNHLQQGLSRVAEGDLDQQIEIINRDEVGKLASSFKSAVASLRQVIRGVQISESLQRVTMQLASVSKQQAVGSNEQVIALNEVVSAMQELGMAAEQIADNAAQVAGLTGNTLEQIEQVAEVGQTSQQRAQMMVEVIGRTLAGVEQVGNQVEQFRQTLHDLNRKSEAINRVVNLLGSISDEVHLLALNAAIEAAGAGQAGQRFRVVAHQIKQLAVRANQATQEARQLVNGVQISSRTALTQVEEGQAEIVGIVEANSDLRESLQQLEQSARQVGEAVNYLLTLAGQVSDRTEEIKQATRQQQATSELVIVSAHSVEEVAEQNAQTTHQIVASSNQLELLTNQLNGVLSQVKIAA